MLLLRRPKSDFFSHYLKKATPFVRLINFYASNEIIQSSKSQVLKTYVIFFIDALCDFRSFHVALLKNHLLCGHG